MENEKFDLNFKLILISKTISVVGGNILGFAMILFLVDFTQSAALFGVISALSQIPTFFLTPFAGVLADRMDKKRLIVLFDVLTALSNFFFLWLLMSGRYTILNITVLRMIKISILVFATTVFNAAVPRVVEEKQLVGANGALQSIAAIGLIGGSVIGGILFSVIGIQLITFASGVLFMVSAGLSVLIHIPHVALKEADGMFQTVKNDMVESFHFVKNKKPIIFKIALVDSFITLLFPSIFMVGLPFIVGIIFEQEVTLSFGIAAIGMLVGGICANRLTQYLAIKYLAKWLGAIGGACALLALAFSPILPTITLSFWLFNVTLMLILFILALIGSSLHAFIQQEVPAPLLGKINALLSMMGLIAGPLGLFAVGFFIEVTPLPVFFLGVTLLTWMMTLICSRVLKHYFKNMAN
ncbi:MAG: MFS transporter [Defluviitaleaceae bacterium]|nr:MFS transporter [Defluviitaleaceae bacterium]